MTSGSRSRTRSRSFIIPEEEEANDNSDSGDNDEHQNSSSPVRWGNLCQDFKKESTALKNLKARISALDKEYRSRKDETRSDLYIALKRYFKNCPVSRFRMFLPDFSDKKFEEFLKPRPGLEKLKAWDLKFKIQKVLRNIEVENREDRIFLYSAIGRLDLTHLAKNSNMFLWTTYRFQNRKSGTEGLSNMPLKEYMATIKNQISSGLKDIELELCNENEKTKQFFYVHSKVFSDMVFFGIRKQISINSKSTKKRVKKINPLKEKAEKITIVTKQGFPHIFVTGSIAQENLILELLAHCLGFEATVNQNLIGKDLSTLMEICNEKVEYPPLDMFESNFREQEVKMAEIGFSYGNRVAELAKQYEMAGFKGSGDSASAKKGTQTISLNSKFSNTQLKTKGSRADVDAFILESYQRGYITDLKPFLKMKEEHSNVFNLDDDSDKE